MQKWFNTFYTYWLSLDLKKCGEKCFFLHPVYLGNPKYIEIGKSTRIGRRTMIVCTDKFNNQQFRPSIIIGNDCEIGDDCNIQCCDSISIGNGVLFGRKIMLNDSSHGVSNKELLMLEPNKRPLISKGPIIIGDNVWIGENVVILGGVSVGNGTIIGANSVVTRDIPPLSVAVGIPASVIKTFTVNDEK